MCVGECEREWAPFPPLRCVQQRNICAYAVVIVVKMAEGETEKEYDTRRATEELRGRFQALTAALKGSSQSSLEASLLFCQDFCQVRAAAHPPARGEDPLSLRLPERMRVRCYNNVAKLAAKLASHSRWKKGEKKKKLSFFFLLLLFFLFFCLRVSV